MQPLCSLGLGAMSLILVFGAACGGEPAPAPAPARAPVSGAVEDEQARAPVKIPRAPFLSLSDSSVEDLAGAILKNGGSDRKLAFPLQRGPFGPAESVLVVFTEQVDSISQLGAYVLLPGGRTGTAMPLPIANDDRLVRASEVVWASSEHGWLAVIVMEREIEEKLTQQNQVFFWSGIAFERALEEEERVRTMSSKVQIRRTLL